MGRGVTEVLVRAESRSHRPAARRIFIGRHLSPNDRIVDHALSSRRRGQ